jgi:hypothetical protein
VYNALSNVREIWDGSPTGTGLAVYDYNGAASRLAVATYPQPSFKLDHFEGTSGTYAALDRFGRAVDQYWKGFGGTSDVDRTHYAYDYVGRRTYRQIDTTIYPTDDRDQAYTYDALRRLLNGRTFRRTDGEDCRTDAVRAFGTDLQSPPTQRPSRSVSRDQQFLEILREDEPTPEEPDLRQRPWMAGSRS